MRYEFLKANKVIAVLEIWIVCLIDVNLAEILSQNKTLSLAASEWNYHRIHWMEQQIKGLYVGSSR